MRKAYWFRATLATAAVCLFCTVSAFAAVVDKEAPYTGSYFMTYNNRLDESYYHADSGPMPALENGAEGTVATWNLFGVTTDETGRVDYQMEPRNMEQWVLPPEDGTAGYALRARSAGAPAVGDEREFVTVDQTSGHSQRTDFVLKYSGEHCNIWLEKDDRQGVTDEMAAELGAEYDVKVHRQLLTGFGPFYDRDGDGKVAFLIYDIQDGYDPVAGGAYIAGFFLPQDLLGQSHNCMDVLHIDSFPAMRDGDITGVKSTMVHEFQHLIEASRIAEDETVAPLPSWVNEGLSMAAEHMIYGPLQDRIDYYNTSVEPGTPLADWNNADALPNYSMSYLFFQYLRVQTQGHTGGGEELYRRIIEGEERTGLCVMEALRQFYPNASMGDILRNFYIALTLKEPTGLYGFRGEEAFNAIEPKLYGSTASKSLGPGAALIRQRAVSGFSPAENYGGYISYAAFSPGEGGVEAPKASVPGGQIDPNRVIYLSCGEPSSTIYYTLDGTDPTTASPVYHGAPLYFTLLNDVPSRQVVVKAVTVRGDGGVSPQVEYTYTVVGEGLDYIRRTMGAAGPSSYTQTATGYATAAAPDGSGLVQVGKANSACLGEKDFLGLAPHPDTEEEAYIVKYSFTGEQEWIRLFGGDEITVFHSVTAVEDGYVAAGYYQLGAGKSSHAGDLAGIPLGGRESFGGLLVKYDLAGNRMWTLTVPSPKNDGYTHSVYFSQVVPYSGGGVIAVGLHDEAGLEPGDHHYNNTSACPYYGEGMVVRVDADGVLRWQRLLTGGVLLSVGELKEGAIAAVGYVDNSFLGQGDWAAYSPSVYPAYTRAAAVLLDPEDGSIQKAVAYHDPDAAQGFYAMTALPEGGLVAVGVSQNEAARDAAPAALSESGEDRSLVLNNFKTGMVARLDADLELKWLRYADSGLRGQLHGDVTWFADVAPAEQGVMTLWRDATRQTGHGTALGGVLTGQTNTSYRDVAVIRYDLEGNVEWKQAIGSSAHETGAYGEIYDSYAGVDLTYLGDMKYAVCGQATHGSTPNHAFLLTFYDGSLPYHNVTGNVGVAGAAIGGVYADAQGNYRLRLRQGQSVTLAPSLTGYDFSPQPVTLTMGEEDLTQDFTAVERLYTLSGQVLDKDGVTPLAGVQVAAGVVTDADGRYSLQVRPGTSVTLEPQADGKTFFPARLQRPGVRADESGLDFRVPKLRFTVSGVITHREDARGQGGVRIGSTITEHDGSYSFSAEEGSALTLTPSFPGYHFEPQTFSLPTLTENVTKDFTMEPGPAPETPDHPGGSGGGTGGGSGSSGGSTGGSSGGTGGSGGGSGSSGGSSGGPGKDVTPEKPTAQDPLHPAYLIGYPDGTFRPDASLTRAQCAAMLSRLTEGFDDRGDYEAADFPDVEASKWYAVYIAFACREGIVNGYPDGTFRPDRPMTRAEFAKIVSNALGAQSTEQSAFPDTAGHWAESAVADLAGRGILSGYPDGTFRPDEVITRGEAAKILNLAYHRSLKKEEAPDQPRPVFPDLQEDHWAYYEIWEASTEHQSSLFHP